MPPRSVTADNDTIHALFPPAPYLHHPSDPYLIHPYTEHPHAYYDPYTHHLPALSLYNNISDHPSGPPVPPPPHNNVPLSVYELSCGSCNIFFTNRAMRAVLLLSPGVSLYSTDALPVNCSTPPSSITATDDQDPSRMCDCLTQTLACHGCGGSVGYAIVMPCQRCSSSVDIYNNAANGHRFVFHQNRINATERRYIKGEAGIIASQHPRPLYPPLSSPSGFNPTTLYPPWPWPTRDEWGDDEDDEYKHPSPLSSPSHPRVRLSPSTTSSSASPAVQQATRSSTLRHGDVLSWHNLVRRGNIPGTYRDEERAEMVGKEGSMEYLRSRLRALR